MMETVEFLGLGSSVVDIFRFVLAVYVYNCEVYAHKHPQVIDKSEA